MTRPRFPAPPAPLEAAARRTPLQTFMLYRLQDESGVSGTGYVAEGVVFSNGWVALMWLSDSPSMAFYPSIATVEAVHGHGGKTRVVYL
jgi:hypothetical protein